MLKDKDLLNIEKFIQQWQGKHFVFKLRNQDTKKHTVNSLDITVCLIIVAKINVN